MRIAPKARLGDLFDIADFADSFDASAAYSQLVDNYDSTYFADFGNFNYDFYDTNASFFSDTPALNSADLVQMTQPDYEFLSGQSNLIDPYSAQEIPEVYENVGSGGGGGGGGGSNWDTWNQQIADAGGQATTAQMDQALLDYEMAQTNPWNSDYGSSSSGFNFPRLPVPSLADSGITSQQAQSVLPGSAQVPARISIPGISTPAAPQPANGSYITPSSADVAAAVRLLAPNSVIPGYNAATAGNGQITPAALAAARQLIAAQQASSAKSGSLTDLIDKTVQSVQDNPGISAIIAIGAVMLLSSNRSGNHGAS